MTRTVGRLTIVAIALAMLAAPAAQATVLDGPGSDEPLLVDETFDGGTAVSVTLELSGPALYRIDVIGHGPRDSTPISMGFVEYDDKREWNGSFIITTFESQERHETHVAGEDLPAPAVTPSRIGAEPITALIPSDEDRERPCPLACVSRLELPDRTSAGAYHHSVWIGGVDHSRLQIVGDENVENVDVSYGNPVVAGSSDFEQGVVNVQHQPTTSVADERVFAGAKAMHGATYDAQVDHGLYGVFGLADFKNACYGLCVGSDTARGACNLLVPTECGIAELAYSGPDVSAEGGQHYTFDGTAPGSWSFETNQLVDAWGPSVSTPELPAFVDPGEHHVYLSTADLPIPPEPSR